MFQWLRSKYQQYRYQKIMRGIREDLLFFGHDLSHLTDQEIEQGISEAGKIIAETGVTIDEAVYTFQKLQQAFQGDSDSVSVDFERDVGVAL